MRHADVVFTGLASLAIKLAARLELADGLYRTPFALTQPTEQSCVIHYDVTTKVFCLDGADVTYVLGINEHQKCKPCFGASGSQQTIRSLPQGLRSPSLRFDMSVNTTQHKFARYAGTASGAYWMQHGIDVQLRGNFQAAAFILAQAD